MVPHREVLPWSYTTRRDVIPSPSEESAVLLGVTVADALQDLADSGTIPDASQVAAVLTSDLYADRSGVMGGDCFPRKVSGNGSQPVETGKR